MSDSQTQQRSPGAAASAPGPVAGLAPESRSERLPRPTAVRRRVIDSFLVHKCREARNAVQASLSVYEGLYEAYRLHLHWIDPDQLPGELRRELRALCQNLCRFPASVCVTSADMGVRYLDRRQADELGRRLIALCDAVEALESAAAGNPGRPAAPR